ncbi:MAG: acyl-CoA thioesterase [Spirochaetia bacterium]
MSIFNLMEHTCTLAVRSYECDGYRHVNNAVYLNYLEFARIEFLRDIGFDYERMREMGFGIFVKSISIEFKSPAEAGDTLTIVTEPIIKKRASGTFRQIIYKGGAVSAAADVTWVFVDSSGKPSKIPDEFDRPQLIPEM